MTTIGTGDLSPKTQAGRCFFIFHALFGLPIFLWTLTTLAESILGRAARGRKYLGFTKRQGNTRWVRFQNFFLDPEDQVGLTFTCFVVAWAVGSVVMAYVEPISVIDAVYFMFSVLTTVGFGDIVCTHTACRVTVLVLGYVSIGLLSAFLTATLTSLPKTTSREEILGTALLDSHREGA